MRALEDELRVLLKLYVGSAAFQVARTPARIGPVVTAKLDERRAIETWLDADHVAGDLRKDQKALDLLAGKSDSTLALRQIQASNRARLHAAEAASDLSWHLLDETKAQFVKAKNGL
mmetsp:Transcript_50443/g.118397  ORF Transcript_50443/g.118397 Transcript_50443/m.118397 type:complete len:117 (-) Transcript_50443:130-480(-)